MALPAKAIKGKIVSVKNVGKITKAMELVSVSKMKRSTDAVLKTRDYATRALELLAHLSQLSIDQSPFLTHGSSNRNLIVVVASNKGLCGNFNVNVEKNFKAFIKRILAKHDSEIDVVCVGKRAEKIVRRAQVNVIASFIDFNETISSDEAYSLSRLLSSEFQKGIYHNVVVVYTEYVSALSNHVVARQILPVKPENLVNMLKETWRDDTVELVPVQEDRYEGYIIEPNKKSIARSLLLRLAHMELYQALLESSASEHSSRMFSMKNATENAKKLADELTLSYNQARQAGITRELSEIASGADALAS